MEIISLKDVNQSFDDKAMPALRDINLSIDKGQRVVLIGPNGAGKSTLLRVLSGELKNFAGTRSVAAENLELLEGIQSLDESKTLLENIHNDFVTMEQTRAIIEDFHLESLVDKKPTEVSSGQFYRTILAKYLNGRKELVLMDEPWVHLDQHLTWELQGYLKNYLESHQITCVLATHNFELAYAFADKIAVIQDGRIQQYDSPENIYNKPKTMNVVKFLGEANLIVGTIKSESPMTLTSPLGDYEIPKENILCDDFSLGDTMVGFFRSNAIEENDRWPSPWPPFDRVYTY